MTIRAALARGFTLIEMAIVMVVIGLVLSGGLVAVAPVVQNTKISETNEKLDRVEQSLILYAIRNGCLPCPADPAAPSDGSGTNPAGESIKATATNAYISGCTSTAACSFGETTQGSVPWVTLGLSEGDVTDGFGTRIDYSVTSALAHDNGLVRTPPSTYPSGALTVNNYSGRPQTTAAAYVLVSHGIDRFGGYVAGSGNHITSGTYSSSTTQAENKDGDTTFIQDVFYPIGTTTYFDDIVRWRSAPMIVQLCGTNACGNPA
jgi:prepilin-type N-terminal cleavage/methylation domain-containing protein